MLLKILLVYVLHIDYITSALPPSKLFGPEVDHLPYHLRKENYDLICRLQPNGFPCTENYTSAKFYFDVTMKTCMTFYYSDCQHSHNRFDMLNECNSICSESVLSNDKVLKNLTRDVICRLQPESGSCYKYYPMFYFDVSTRICKGFSYSGCEGNFNRFETELECKTICNEAVRLPEPISYKPTKI